MPPPGHQGRWAGLCETQGKQDDGSSSRAQPKMNAGKKCERELTCGS